MRNPSRFKFNKRQIDSLPATPADSRSRETEYSDEASTGLRLIVNRQVSLAFIRSLPPLLSKLIPKTSTKSIRTSI